MTERIVEKGRALKAEPPRSIGQQAQVRLDQKTKPPGSLGRLEELAVRIAQLQGTLEPELRRKRVCVFASSHGLSESGVSPYPAAVTGQMVLNFLQGGAAINVLARHGGIEVQVIDVGVDTEWPEPVLSAVNFLVRKERRGTRNALKERAMSAVECEAAMEAGREQARMARAGGVDLLGIGEMGIGNSTSAALLYAALLGLAPDQAVGRGTGADPEMVKRKSEVVGLALALHQGDAKQAENTGRYWLEAVGGYEIAAMTGAILEATKLRLPIVVDGFISSAAAAVAFAIEPASRDVCFFSHRSDEQAHGTVLQALGVEPLLDLQMRLGEGTGAALAMHLLEASVKILCEMATFASAGVDEATAASAS